VRLRGRRDGSRTWWIEQQLDARLATIATAAHVLPQARPPSGAPHTSPGHHPGPDLALEEGSLLYYEGGDWKMSFHGKYSVGDVRGGTSGF